MVQYTVYAYTVSTLLRLFFSNVLFFCAQVFWTDVIVKCMECCTSIVYATQSEINNPRIYILLTFWGCTGYTL